VTDTLAGGPDEVRARAEAQGRRGVQHVIGPCGRLVPAVAREEVSGREAGRPGRFPARLLADGAADLLRLAEAAHGGAHPVADKLQGTGLITRQPHPTDGRKRTLALTERGQQLWEALSTRLHVSGVLAGLDADEQRTLYALLTKIQLPQRP
jgi:hypothetical protein